METVQKTEKKLLERLFFFKFNKFVTGGNDFFNNIMKQLSREFTQGSNNSQILTLHIIMLLTKLKTPEISQEDIKTIISKIILILGEYPNEQVPYKGRVLDDEDPFYLPHKYILENAGIYRTIFSESM